MESIIEALGDEYEDSPTLEIDKKIKQISRSIVNNKLNNVIAKYLHNELDISGLINSVVEIASSIQLGDF